MSPVMVACLLVAGAIIGTSSALFGEYAFGAFSRGGHAATAATTRSASTFPSAPAREPSGGATATPTAAPSGGATATPTAVPTGSATATPTAAPTGIPTGTPEAAPTSTPQATPTSTPNGTPNGGGVLAGTFHRLPSEYAEDEVNYLTVGPDGAVWFTWSQYLPQMYCGLGSMTAAGDTEIWGAPAAWGDCSSGPLVSGGGYLWAVATHGSPGFPYIDQWTTAGQLLADYPIPGLPPGGITWSDGEIWFTGPGSPGSGWGIDRMTTAGAVTSFTLPNQSAAPASLVAADGDVWFSVSGGTYVGRVTPSGQITDLPIAGATASGILPQANLAVASDGSIWMSSLAQPNVGFVHIATDGTVTSHPLQSAGASACAVSSNGAGGPSDIAIDAAGDVWGATPWSDVCELVPSGTISAFSVEVSGAFQYLQDMISGPDDLLWCAAQGGLLTFDPSTAPAVTTTSTG
jgi:virginiamycin B lyase